MYHQMENAFAHVEVDELGAQLHSLRRRKDGYEYLWQGDPAIWPGQAPILFPIVGSLAEERYWLGGQPYQMPRHGFARRKRFFCVDESNDRLVFSLTDDVETRAQYPFAFELRVTYLLTGQRLGVTHTVLNPAAEPLYFSLGAHPAFRCEIGDTLRFECREENLHTQRIGADGLRTGELFAVPGNGREIEITEELFLHDALILSGLRSRCVTLESRRKGRVVTVMLGGAPYLGLWAKPGAPFVCIEPWYGVADPCRPALDFTQKQGIQRLEGKGRFDFKIQIELHDF